MCLVKREKHGLQKKLPFKNHVLGIKVKALFSKCVFDKKHGKRIYSQTDPKSVKGSAKPYATMGWKNTWWPKNSKKIYRFFFLVKYKLL